MMEHVATIEQHTSGALLAGNNVAVACRAARSTGRSHSDSLTAIQAMRQIDTIALEQIVAAFLQ
jgi:hypothetical protein